MPGIILNTVKTFLVVELVFYFVGVFAITTAGNNLSTVTTEATWQYTLGKYEQFCGEDFGVCNLTYQYCIGTIGFCESCKDECEDPNISPGELEDCKVNCKVYFELKNLSSTSHSPTTVSSSTQSDDSLKGVEKELVKFERYIIIGSVIGTVIVISLIIAVVIIYRKLRKARRKDEAMHMDNDPLYVDTTFVAHQDSETEDPPDVIVHEQGSSGHSHTAQLIVTT